MQILVVLGLFSLLIVVIIEVYLLSLSSQRQISYRQKNLSNIRYITEVIAQKVRLSEIDYDYSYSGDGDPGINGSETELALYDQGGQRIIYKLNNKEIQAETGGETYSLTNPNELEVINLNFYIKPAVNPFKEERCRQDIGELGMGCLATSLGCSVNDPSNLYSVGFCQCDSNDDCRTKYCDLTENFCLPPNEQPRVTIALGFKSKATKVEEQKTIFLQTTIASRIYRR